MTDLSAYREKKVRDSLEAFKLLGLWFVLAWGVLSWYRVASWVLT